MSILIKRYQNRKLYNTVARQYITLEGIYNLIRHGEEVVVIDNVTGDELTTVILSQVILNNEKKRGGFLPQTILTGLIQTGGMTLNTMRRGLSKSIESLPHFDDEVKRRFQVLVEDGEVPIDQAEELIQRLINVGRRKRDGLLLLEKALQKIISERGAASRDELLKLSEQIEMLSVKLDEMDDWSRSQEDKE